MGLTRKGLAAGRRAGTVASKTVDATTVALGQAWGHAWNEIVDVWDQALIDLVTNPEGKDGWPSRHQIVKSVKAQKALEFTAEQLDKLAAEGALIVSDSVPEMVAAGQKAQKALVAGQLPNTAPLVWTNIDKTAIAWMVQRTTEQIESRFIPLTAEMQAVMKQTLIRGMLIGDNPLDVADLMLDRLHDDFNGGLSRAETIARTEMMDALRASSWETYRANRDVIAGWRWTCSLSSSTCPACLAMDGTIFDLDEPGPEGHQNCRCTAVPVTKSWEELGFDGIEDEPERETGRDWFENQSERTQIKIMGRKRHAAWKTGKIGWDDIPQIRRTRYWRDSIGVAPLPVGV